jgi:hypothetical protein
MVLEGTFSRNMVNNKNILSDAGARLEITKVSIAEFKYRGLANEE